MPTISQDVTVSLDGSENEKDLTCAGWESALLAFTRHPSNRSPQALSPIPTHFQRRPLLSPLGLCSFGIPDERKIHRTKWGAAFPRACPWDTLARSPLCRKRVRVQDKFRKCCVLAAPSEARRNPAAKKPRSLYLNLIDTDNY